MADFPDDLMSICTQSLMAVEKNWNCEDEIDKLLSQVPLRTDSFPCDASEKPWDHELDQLLSDPQPQLGSQSDSSTGHNAGQIVAANRFAKPATAAEIKKAQDSCVPANTKKATSWCLNVWKAWRDYRKTISESNIPAHIMILATNKPEFCRWLCHFVMEVRRQDEAEYPPNSLHQLCCGILRYAREREPELDIFRDTAFLPFQKTLDGEMMAPKHAEPLTYDDEEKMWNEGVLGDSSPKQLLETIVYMCGLYFAMRSETEQYNLRDRDIVIIERPGQTAHVIYNENSSKNNS